MINVDIVHVGRCVFLVAALGILATSLSPAAASDAITVSEVKGKRVKLYNSDSDKKAAQRVPANEIEGSKVTGHTSRRVQIEFGGQSYWVDAYKVKTDPPLNLKDVPVGCKKGSTSLAMTSNSHGYSTARGSGTGCN